MANGPLGVRFVLNKPWSALPLSDAGALHETTPTQPPNPALPPWRETLVPTLRRGGCQGPSAPASTAAGQRDAAADVADQAFTATALAAQGV